MENIMPIFRRTISTMDKKSISFIEGKPYGVKTFLMVKI